jgi:hypothetical protein
LAAEEESCLREHEKMTIVPIVRLSIDSFSIDEFIGG